MKPISTTATPDSSDDAPELTQADFDRARFRVAGRDVDQTEWQRAVRACVQTQHVELDLDKTIVEHFRALAGEDGYRDAINRALLRLISSKDLTSHR